VRSLNASNSRCSWTFCLFSAAHWSAMSCSKTAQHTTACSERMSPALLCTKIHVWWRECPPLPHHHTYRSTQM
jgi:hypothetical protein